MTHEISRVLNIEPKEAEKMKRVFGIIDPQERSCSVLIKVLQNMSKEITNTRNYFKKKMGHDVEALVLIGGSSTLKGLIEYFEANLLLPVSIGKAIFQFGSKDKGVRPSFFYVGAIGLALRNIEKRWDEEDPALRLKALDSHKGHKTGKEKGGKKLLSIGIAAFIIFCAAMFFGVVWYKGEKKIEIISVEQFSTTQSFELFHIVAVVDSEYTDDRIRGRILEDTVMDGEGYEDAIRKSRVNLESALSVDERFWEDPLSPEEFMSPMVLQWLVYSKKDFDQSVSEYIDDHNSDNIAYAIQAIVPNEVEATGNPNLFHLISDVTLALDGPIAELQEDTVPTQPVEDPEPVSTTTESKIIEQEVVVIKDTPTGWLNVRDGPGTEFQVIQQILPGESYPLLEEEEEWYKIKLDEGEGWVFAQYVQIESNK